MFLFAFVALSWKEVLAATLCNVPLQERKFPEDSNLFVWLPALFNI